MNIFVLLLTPEQWLMAHIKVKSQRFENLQFYMRIHFFVTSLLEVYFISSYTVEQGWATPVLEGCGIARFGDFLA